MFSSKYSAHKVIGSQGEYRNMIYTSLKQFLGELMLVETLVKLCKKEKRRDPLWELNSEANLWLAAFFFLNNSTLPELIIARMPKHTCTAGVGCRDPKTSDETQWVYVSTCNIWRQK